MPLLRLFVPLLLLFSFGGVSYGRGSFESLKELADKYELKMPFFTSRCSAARKSYYKTAAKNSYEEIKADP